jgi:hypothetical protein
LTISGRRDFGEVSLLPITVSHQDLGIQLFAYKFPTMDEMPDYKDVKIKELEDTIKVLMEKLAVCGDVQVNGVHHNDEDLEEHTIELE